MPPAPLTHAPISDSDISILLQGGISQQNLPQILRNLGTWRRLFPHAELVLVISTCDLPDQATSAGTPSLQQMHHQLERLQAKALFAAYQAPLPGMKSDSPGANNVNLMISAAKTGLAAVHRRYTLRIRNDLVFCSTAFLDIYRRHIDTLDSQWAIFTQRIMIGEVFTLNPMTLSRMPFHFSDWFQFGLREDLRQIWDAVDYLPLLDAVWYKFQPLPEFSNDVERRFFTRLAPEQWVSYPVFKKHFPALQLNHFNDPASMEASMAILAANYYIVNLKDIHAYIDKYQDIISRMSVYTRLECLSQQAVDHYIKTDTLARRDLKQTWQRSAIRLERKVRFRRSAWFRGIWRPLMRLYKALFGPG